MFFSSDLHFFHKNILKYCATRPYSTIEDMNIGMINKINDTVNNEDFYILGDCSFGTIDQTLDVFNQIKTRNMILVVGNHDHKFVKDERFIKRFKQVHYLTEIKYNKNNYVLCHYPILSWNKCHYGSVMLHGHTHGTLDNGNLNRIDVGIDCFPDLLHINQIEEIIKTRTENRNVLS